MNQFVENDRVTGDQERRDRPPATLFLKDGRTAELPDCSPRQAAALCTLASKLGEKIGDEIDPADIESIGYTDER